MFVVYHLECFLFQIFIVDLYYGNSWGKLSRSQRKEKITMFWMPCFACDVTLRWPVFLKSISLQRFLIIGTAKLAGLFVTKRGRGTMQTNSSIWFPLLFGVHTCITLGHVSENALSCLSIFFHRTHFLRGSFSHKNRQYTHMYLHVPVGHGKY